MIVAHGAHRTTRALTGAGEGEPLGAAVRDDPVLEVLAGRLGRTTRYPQCPRSRGSCLSNDRSHWDDRTRPQASPPPQRSPKRATPKSFLLLGNPRPSDGGIRSLI
jgi:hypothetical protein